MLTKAQIKNIENACLYLADRILEHDLIVDFTGDAYSPHLKYNGPASVEIARQTVKEIDLIVEKWFAEWNKGSFFDFDMWLEIEQENAEEVCDDQIDELVEASSEVVEANKILKRIKADVRARLKAAGKGEK